MDNKVRREEHPSLRMKQRKKFFKIDTLGHAVQSMVYRLWTKSVVSYCCIAIVSHLLWLRQTHQLTAKSVDYKSVMFNSEGPLFKAWLRSNKTLKCKYCFIKLLKGFFLCQFNKTFLQLYHQWSFVNRNHSVNNNKR